MDWVAGFPWTEWQPSHGLGGRHPWNMQIASETFQVEPRNQYIAHLREQVAERGEIIKDWKDACEPISTNYKTLEGHLAECQNTLKQWSVDGKNTIKQWQDALEGWKKQNSELQKTVNSYVSNCSIISEIRALDKRKATIDNWRGDTGYTQKAYDSWERQSADFQARMLVLHNKLTCEPN